MTEPLFNLLEYFRAHWEPVMVRVEQAPDNTPQQVLAVCQWIEAVGWVSLGLDLDLYDEGLSLRLLSASRSRMGTLFEKHRIELEAIIPLREITRVQELLSAGKLSSEASFSKRRGDLASYFFTGESLSQSLNQDESILRYQESLLFGRELPDDPISLPFLIDLLTYEHISPDVYSTEEVITAYVRCLSSLTSWNDLFRDLKLNDKLDIGDRANLQRRNGTAKSMAVQFG